MPIFMGACNSDGVPDSRLRVFRYNLTKDKDCFDIGGMAGPEPEPEPEPTVPARPDSPSPVAAAMHARARRGLSSGFAVERCPTCPPCDDCPPCPVSFCDFEDTEVCTFCGKSLDKTFSWEGIGCNEALSQIDIKVSGWVWGGGRCVWVYAGACRRDPHLNLPWSLFLLSAPHHCHQGGRP